MTAAQIVAAAVTAPVVASTAALIWLGFRAAFRDPYPERAGRDDHRDATAVRAPLAIEGRRRS